MVIIALEVDDQTRMTQRVLSEPNPREQTIAYFDSLLVSAAHPDAGYIEVESLRSPREATWGEAHETRRR